MTEYTIVAETIEDAWRASEAVDRIMARHAGPIAIYYRTREAGPMPGIDTGYLDGAGLDLARRRLARCRMTIEPRPV